MLNAPKLKSILSKSTKVMDSNREYSKESLRDLNFKALLSGYLTSISHNPHGTLCRYGKNRRPSRFEGTCPFVSLT